MVGLHIAFAFLVGSLPNAIPESKCIILHRGVGAEQLGDVLALAGDSSDNIPGVRSSWLE